MNFCFFFFGFVIFIKIQYYCNVKLIRIFLFQSDRPKFLKYRKKSFSPLKMAFKDSYTTILNRFDQVNIKAFDSDLISILRRFDVEVENKSHSTSLDLTRLYSINRFFTKREESHLLTVAFFLQAQPQLGLILSNDVSLLDIA